MRTKRPPRAVTLTDGSPVPLDGSHRELRPDGQQRGYVVLSEEERARGYVRPVRTSYRHVGIASPTNLQDLTAIQLATYGDRGYVKYEIYSPSKAPTTGRFWTQADLDRVNAGCGTVTTMTAPLAETYARQPNFYDATFCRGCRKHLPVEEFVWEGTDDRVGS